MGKWVDANQNHNNENGKLFSCLFDFVFVCVFLLFFFFCFGFLLTFFLWFVCLQIAESVFI